MQEGIVMKALLVAAVALAGAAQAAEITIYKQPDFSGEQMTLRDASGNLGARFTDQASSAVVRSGRWELCTQPDFKGECMTLGPGEYARLDSRLFHRVESARSLDPIAYDDRGSGYGGYRQGGAIELYAGTAFRGRPYRINRDVEELVGRRGEGFGVGSVVVNEGRWQLCTDPGYQGYCQVLEPGEYAHFARVNNQIGSIRRIG
jgi:hypothetical protein